MACQEVLKQAWSPSELIQNGFSFKIFPSNPNVHQKPIVHRTFCMQDNPLRTKTPVKLTHNSNVTSLSHQISTIVNIFNKNTPSCLKTNLQSWFLSWRDILDPDFFFLKFIIIVQIYGTFMEVMNFGVPCRSRRRGFNTRL